MSDKMLIDRATVQQALDALYHMCENTTAADGYNQMQVADALLKLDRVLAAAKPLPAGCTRVELTAEQEAGLTCRASHIPGVAAPQPAQSLALQAALGYVERHTPNLVYTEIAKAVAAPQPAHDQGLIATLAGLEASTGHLSAIVDQQRALLAEVEDVFGRDERGIPFEDGDSMLIDKVRAHLACIATPQAPQPAQEPAGYANKFDIEQMRQHGGGTLLWQFEPDDSGDYAALYATPQAPQPLTNPEPLHELARVCFDAGIKHGQGAKNGWFTDGKALAIIDRITKGPAA